MSDNFPYRYRPTAPLTHAHIPSDIRWHYVETPHAMKPSLVGCPASEYEFGVIATNKEIGYHDRNQAKLEVVK